ncbi:MAG: trypsin-like peptidase domain-containing protein [Ktedonobacteraceae bacterium]|nr:trypsin-like peptidase domain-containing protein [Ktedonobacteraceae bacterium]
MYRKMYMQSLAHKKYRWFSLVIGISILCTLLFALSGRGAVAYADGLPPGGNISDPVVRAVDIAKPAVVRIITVTSGRLTVNFTQEKSAIFPQGTGQAYRVALSGSGTFISANGDILTASHVVSPPDEVFYRNAAPDIANYINQHPELGLPQTTPDQVLQNLMTRQLKAKATFDAKRSEVFLSTDYSGPLTANSLEEVPPELHATVDQIKKESAFDQKDVAIVHAPFKDTPSVQLGDSSTVQQQDQLTIIGFPGNGDVSNRPTDLFTSSVNKINVSSIKTTDNGAPVIQVGGNVEQGDSGGPALDNSGKVVGIVSFGLASGSTPGGTSFLQASNSARELIQSLNLDTTPGSFQKLWSQSFSDYASTTPGHWHKAQQGFQQLATKYPLFKAVTPYLNYAQTQARSEQAVTPTATSPAQPAQPAQSGTTLALAITIGSIVVILLLGSLLMVVAVRRGKRSKAGGTAPTQSEAAKPARPQRPGQPGQPGQPASSQAGYDEGMAAFGAPAKSWQAGRPAAPQGSQPPGQARPASPPLGSQATAALRVWPCGHMNRPNARFCAICGEPASDITQTTLPPIKRVEQ